MPAAPRRAMSKARACPMPPAAPVITATCPSILCILMAPPDGASTVPTLYVSRPGPSMFIPSRAVRLRSSAVQRPHVFIPGFGQHFQHSAPHLAHLVEGRGADVQGAVNVDSQGGQRAFDQILHAARRIAHRGALINAQRFLEQINRLIARAVERLNKLLHTLASLRESVRRHRLELRLEFLGGAELSEQLFPEVH